MSDRIGEDALLDVGCCLNRFEVDSIQCLSWKSHTYLANKGHILPVRLLHTAQISCRNVYVDNRQYKTVNCRGTPHEAFLLALAAIKHSDLKYFILHDPTGHPITEEEVAQIATVAATVTVTDVRLRCQFRHLSPPVLHRLIFSFSSIEELTLYRFNGNQLTDEHLRECGRRQIWRLYMSTDTSDAGPCAFSDDALLDYLYAPEHGMPKRRVVVSSFNSSPQFVQKLINRAQMATNGDRIDLDVYHLPLRSQQLGGMRLTENQGFAKHFEQLENGARLSIGFGREPASSYRCRMLDDEEESDDKFTFTLWK